MTGTEETRPTGPNDRLILNKSIPRIGGAMVYSNNNMENNMANPLPITKTKVKNGLQSSLRGTYSSKYVYQIDLHKHPRKASRQQVKSEPH
jgi:hypothetical protein